MLIESIYMHILSLYLIIKGIIQIIIELSQAAAQTLSEGPRGHITIAFERLLQDTLFFEYVLIVTSHLNAFSRNLKNDFIFNSRFRF